MIKIGDRVITPGGHTGTVLSILDDTSVEVELDFGGLMHYNVHTLKVILMPA
jgi:preprotein translocase subunit YajC